MTADEKVVMTQTLVENDELATSRTVGVYLQMAEQKILDRLYPYRTMNRGDGVPEMYHVLQCELAARLFLRRGSEGEKSHEENGVNRTYGSVDDEDILQRIVPYAAVM